MNPKSQSTTKLAQLATCRECQDETVQILEAVVHLAGSGEDPTTTMTSHDLPKNVVKTGCHVYHPWLGMVNIPPPIKMLWWLGDGANGIVFTTLHLFWMFMGMKWWISIIFIGLVGKSKPESTVFPIKYGWGSCKCSLKAIQWHPSYLSWLWGQICIDNAGLRKWNRLHVQALDHWGSLTPQLLDPTIWSFSQLKNMAFFTSCWKTIFVIPFRTYQSYVSTGKIWMVYAGHGRSRSWPKDQNAAIAIPSDSMIATKVPFGSFRRLSATRLVDAWGTVAGL